MRVGNIEFGLALGMDAFSVDKCPNGCSIFSFLCFYLTILRGVCKKR